MTAEKLVAGPLRGLLATWRKYIRREMDNEESAPIGDALVYCDAMRHCADELAEALASLPSSPLRGQIEAMRDNERRMANDCADKNSRQYNLYLCYVDAYNRVLELLPSSPPPPTSLQVGHEEKRGDLCEGNSSRLLTESPSTLPVGQRAEGAEAGGNSFDFWKAAKNLHDLQRFGEALGLHAPAPPVAGEPRFRKIVEWLHHKMAAAQNLPYEDGDVCLDCADAVRDELRPLMETAAALGSGQELREGDEGPVGAALAHGGVEWYRPVEEGTFLFERRWNEEQIIEAERNAKKIAAALALPLAPKVPSPNDTEPLDDPRLEPCPFCGSANDDLELTRLGDEDSFYVHCKRCEIQQIANYTRLGAIDKWNRRPLRAERDGGK